MPELLDHDAIGGHACMSAVECGTSASPGARQPCTTHGMADTDIVPLQRVSMVSPMAGFDLDKDACSHALCLDDQLSCLHGHPSYLKWSETLHDYLHSGAPHTTLARRLLQLSGCTHSTVPR
jgi:hypothetical protein